MILFKVFREDTELNYIIATVIWWPSHTPSTKPYMTQAEPKSNLHNLARLLQESSC